MRQFDLSSRNTPEDIRILISEMRKTFVVFARRLALVVLAVSGFTMKPPAPSESGSSPYLEERIGTILRSPGVQSAFWGIHVINVATGEVLYSHNGDKRLIPASNLKLLTTSAALDALSGSYRFQTVLYLRGHVEGDTIVGDLVIRGSGDPSFGSSRYREDPLEKWARDLADLGVRRISGRIIGDDNVYEDDPYPEGWDVRLVATRTYATSISGLSYRDNVVDLVLRGGAAGSPVRVTLVPGAHILVDNAAVSGRGGGIRLFRLPGNDAIRLDGGLPNGRRRHFRLPVANPTRFALAAFVSYLEENGIEVDASLEDRDEMTGFPGYQGARPLMAHVSPPLGALVQVVNKYSNNFYAEQIMRAISGNGDARSAERRIRDLVSRAGASTQGISVTDGSGLSRKNLVTPEALAAVLAYMFTHPEWDTFSSSLPTGGERGSTLAGRLSGVPVQAKTGSLEFARALSGYVYARDNSVLAFSAIANNYAASGGAISNSLDAIVRAIAGYSGE